METHSEKEENEKNPHPSPSPPKLKKEKNQGTWSACLDLPFGCYNYLSERGHHHFWLGVIPLTKNWGTYSIIGCAMFLLMDSFFLSRWV
jgi:hypothetical protein